jgi:hypothetical protein
MVACLGARVQLFGRDLAVIQTMCKLAGIEEQLGQQVQRGNLDLTYVP